MESSKLVFTENLFPATPSAERYAPVGSIEAARTRLIAALQRCEGPGLIIGASGTGKSLLCDLLRQQFESRFHVVLLAEARIRTRRSLFQHILHHLALPYSHLSEGELRLSLFDLATRDREDGGRGIVLIVDEAQGLPGRLLEELRLLTGIVHEGESRIQLILCGSQSLDERLSHPKLEPLSQRIAARCYLHPMTHQETGGYIRALLARSRNIRWEIEEEAIRSAYFASDGVARLINQTMGLAIGEALSEGTHRITSLHVDRAWVSLQQLPGPSHALHAPTSNHDDFWSDNEREATTSTNTTSSIEFGFLDEPVKSPRASSYDPMAETVDYVPSTHRREDDLPHSREQDQEQSSDRSSDESFDEQVESDIDERVVRFEAKTIPNAKTESLYDALFGSDFEVETAVAASPSAAKPITPPYRGSTQDQVRSGGLNLASTEICIANDAPTLDQHSSDLVDLGSVEIAFVEDSATLAPSCQAPSKALSEELSIHQQVVALNRETACQAGVSFSTVTSNSHFVPASESLRFDAEQESHNPRGEIIDSFEYRASTTDLDIVDLIEPEESLPSSIRVNYNSRESQVQPASFDISIRDDRDLLVIEDEIQNDASSLFRLRPTADQETIADQRALLDRMRDI